MFLKNPGILALMAAGLGLAACGGRTAMPIDTVRPVVDRSHDCDTIVAEISANKKKIYAREDERQRSNATNAGVGAVGVLLFPPLLFALDVKKTEQTEINAFVARNDYLRQLAVRKRCGSVPPRFTKEEYQKIYDQRIKDADKAASDPTKKQ